MNEALVIIVLIISLGLMCKKAVKFIREILIND